MSIELDKVQLSTLTGAYINYDTKTGSITISGSVPALDTASFSTSVSYSRNQTVADVYLQSSNNNRMLANTIQRIPIGGIYTFAGSETFTTYISYSSSTITVEFFIFNSSGSPLALTTQTITVSAVLYDAPFS